MAIAALFVYGMISMSIRNDLLEKTQLESGVLSSARQRVVSLSEPELSTLLGLRYYFEYDEEYTTNESKYIILQMPPLSSGYYIGFQNRDFKAVESFAEIEILWDSSGYVVGDAITTFNENRNSSNVATLSVNELSTDPTDDGSIRERDFLGSDGNPQSRGGGVSSELGFRLYSPDSFAIIKITNGSNAQRIHLAYEWYEIPTTEINYGG